MNSITKTKSFVRPTTTLEWALAYVDIGWSVLVLPPSSKIPAKGSNGVYDATNDKALLRKLITDNPNCNLAIAVAPSGLGVVDKDRHANKATSEIVHDGITNYQKLSSKHSPSNGLVAISGNKNGGEHEIFKAPDVHLNHDPLPGVQVLSEPSQYVLVEPSIHPDGNQYKWKRDGLHLNVRYQKCQIG